MVESKDLRPPFTPRPGHNNARAHQRSGMRCSILSTSRWCIPSSARRALLDDSALGDDAALCDAVAGGLGFNEDGGLPAAAAATDSGEDGTTPSPAGKHFCDSSSYTPPAEQAEGAGREGLGTPQVSTPRHTWPRALFARVRGCGVCLAPCDARSACPRPNRGRLTRRPQDCSEPPSTSAHMVGSFEDFMRSQSQGESEAHRSSAPSDDAAADSHPHEEELPRVRPRRSVAARSSRLSPELLQAERPTAAAAASGRPPRAAVRPGFRSSCDDQVIRQLGAFLASPLTVVCVQAFKLSDAESLASGSTATQAACAAPPASASDAGGGREMQAVRPAPLRDASRLCKCKRSKCIRQYCICFRRVFGFKLHTLRSSALIQRHVSRGQNDRTHLRYLQAALYCSKHGSECVQMPKHTLLPSCF
jgi:hypothetical protein